MLQPDDIGAASAFAEATVRVATPLALAALGETITERAGVVNIGLEGAMLAGALAGALGAMVTGSPWAGLVAGVLAGALVAALFAGMTVGLGGDQIVVGTAVTLLSLGLTGAVYRAAFGAAGAALSLPTLGPVPLPALAAVPLLGPALFAQPVPTYLWFAMAPMLWWLLRDTQAGLAIRACGDAPDAATAAGISVPRVRALATVFGGAMAGLAGATLVLAQAGTFAERMTAGRGFIAIAIVVLGRWNPLGACAAALLFGAASALQYGFQAAGTAAPYQFFLMVPYLVTLLALAGVGGRARAPLALGK